jgi:hypothetical protein
LIQAKLTVRDPGDVYEQEADRVAERVTRVPEPPPHRHVDEKQQEELFTANSLAHRTVDGDAGGDGAPPIVEEVLRSPGQGLDLMTRSFMEGRFGYNFSGVRVHTDAAAAESARQVNACAYTVGRHVVFGKGQYTPRSNSATRLLAHELAHVVQQGAADRSARSSAAPALSRGEHATGAGACDLASNSAARLNGKPLAGGGPALQRMVFVNPPSAAREIRDQFEKMCPGRFGTAAGKGFAQITADCSPADRSRSKSCQCLCDTAHDMKRRYSINVAPAKRVDNAVNLHDGTPATVPDTSVFPETVRGDHPVITMPASKGSDMEFGAFSPEGTPLWYESWRILAHELCGHARLGQNSTEANRGCRLGHNASIGTENEIAKEQNQPDRGTYFDRRQGESFVNPVKNRSKVLFFLCHRGRRLHFENPFEKPHEKPSEKP